MLRGRFREEEATPDEMVAAAMAGEGVVNLGRGLGLRARHVAGTRPPELEGWKPAQVPALQAAGCFTEIMAHQLRVFAPVGEAAAGVVAAMREGRGMPAEAA